MKLASMNMMGVLDRIITPVLKSYFADVAFEYRQDQLMETKSKMFNMSQRLVSIADMGASIQADPQMSKKMKPRASCFVPPTQTFNHLLGSDSSKGQGEGKYNTRAPNSQVHLGSFLSPNSTVMRTQESTSSLDIK